MAASKRICWDSCAWIAVIQKEKVQVAGKTEDRHALGKSVIDLATKGSVEIVVSGLCLVEVCKHPKVKQSTSEAIAAYFENDYILLVPLDKAVGTKARELMAEGHAGLKPPDAVHLATALLANVDEMHTFDGKLLALDEKLTKADGTALKICKPAHGGDPLPLLEAANLEGKPDEAEAPAPLEAQPGAPAQPAPAVQGDGEGAGVQPERAGVRPAAKKAG